MKKAKRVVLGTGSLDWEDGSGWLMLDRWFDDIPTGRHIQKKYMGKRIRLIAEIIESPKQIIMERKV